MEKSTLLTPKKRNFLQFGITRRRRDEKPRADQDSTFSTEVLAGLRSVPKHLPSKYLYDSRGDALFQQITTLPEYYLTRCETEILSANSGKIARLTSRFAEFRLVELGPGDGHKTKILLRELVNGEQQFTYYPIDISSNALGLLRQNLAPDFPDLRVCPLAADYMTALDEIGRASHQPCLILFMGGNIGNFSKQQAAEFLGKLSARMRSGDMLLCGFDLKKDPAVIYHAYNDRQGVTRSFNFNLLRRINHELGADFNPDNFMHYPTYDPQSGEMKSYLIAVRAHKVRFSRPKEEVSFARWEPVFMEVSNKYSEDEIRGLCSEAGLLSEAVLSDKKKYYMVALLRKDRKNGTFRKIKGR